MNKAEQSRHPSHDTRFSFDASSYDEVCKNCGATDIAGGGWGKLAEPCPTEQIDRDAAAELERHCCGSVRQLYETVMGVPIASRIGTECACGAAFQGDDEQEVRHQWATHAIAALASRADAGEPEVSDLHGAVATAIYDAFHTARLSEHPEDVDAYRRYAASFRHWLKVQGYEVAPLRDRILAALRSPREKALRNEALEEAAKVADDHAKAREGEPQFGGFALAMEVEANRIAAAIRALQEQTDAD